MTRLDFAAANNADFARAITLAGGPATAPWAAVAIWAAATAYSLPSFCQFNGDIYCATAPAAFTSAATFTDDIVNWTRIAAAADFAAAPFSLAGKSLAMSVAAAGPNGPPIAPVAVVMALNSSAGGGLAILGPDADVIAITRSARQMRALAAGSYWYDLIAIGTDTAGATTRRRIVFGALTIYQGVS